MTKKPLVYAFAVAVSILVFTNGDVVANDPQPTNVQSEEYLSIIHKARYEVLIIRPGGKCDFQDYRSVTLPERVSMPQEQAYVMHLAIEKCAKEGYKLVDVINSSYAIMKRSTLP